MTAALICTNIITLILLIWALTRDTSDGNVNPPTCDVLDPGNPPNLDLRIAQKLVKTYGEQHYRYINSNSEWQRRVGNNQMTEQHTDSRSVWFRIEALKRFICEIEAAAMTNCKFDKGVQLGVRIYFGSYPESTDTAFWDLFNNVPLPGGYTSVQALATAYGSKHTVVLVPTYSNGVANIDFDPTMADGNNNPLPVRDIFARGAMATAPTYVLMLNHGGLVPPPFDPPPPPLAANAGADLMTFADLL